MLSVAHSERLAPLIAPRLELATVILQPVIWITELVFSRIGGAQHDGRISASDMMTLAGLARTGKVIGLEQETIILNALRFHPTTVKDVKIPRERIAIFRKALPMEENLKLARECVELQ